MGPRAARALHRTGRVALSVTAVVGVVCALLTVLALVTGVRPLVFRSGSMGPDVPAGSLGFSRTTQAAQLKVGDVVTVTTKAGDKVTHRVVNVTYHDDVATVQLKGDANTVADADLYQITSAPRLLFSVPEAGYAVSWLSHAPGSYLLALYVALMLSLVARRKGTGTSTGSADLGVPTPESPPTAAQLPQPTPTGGALATPAEPPGRGPRRALVIGVVVAVAAVALAGYSQTTWASWSDAAGVSGSTISSGTWVVAPPAAPVITGCTPANGETGYTLTWTWGPGNPDSFKMTYTNLNPAGAVAATPFAGSARTGISAPFNDRSGTINLVATVGGVDSVVDTATFSGKNNGKVCNF